MKPRPLSTFLSERRGCLSSSRGVLTSPSPAGAAGHDYVAKRQWQEGAIWRGSGTLGIPGGPAVLEGSSPGLAVGCGSRSLGAFWRHFDERKVTSEQKVQRRPVDKQARCSLRHMTS